MSAMISADDLFQRHQNLMSMVHYAPPPPKPQQGSTDIEILAQHYRFVMPDEEEKAKTWESRMAKRYYDKLFKEYALADMSRYKEGKIGLRWRTEREVIAGKGQFTCGNKRCDSREGLCSYELNFKYAEHGQVYNELVKVRACPACSDMLFYNRSSRHREAALARPRLLSAYEPSAGEGASPRKRPAEGGGGREDGDTEGKRRKGEDGGDKERRPLFPATRPSRPPNEDGAKEKKEKEKGAVGEDKEGKEGEGKKGEDGEEKEGEKKEGEMTATTRLTEEEADAFIRDLLL